MARLIAGRWWSNWKQDRSGEVILTAAALNPSMRKLRLPDGLEVFALNADETRFVHGEVFGARCYLQHGIELRDGDCVFDVGANIGLATLFFHRERRTSGFMPSNPAR